MAKVIEFYVPTRFQKKVKWTPPQDRGRILIFHGDARKSA
jgi:hypothetical protein